MGDHDALFKRIFAVPAHAAAELRSVLPPELVAVLDFSRLTLVSPSFVSIGLDERHGDLLFRAPLLHPGEDDEDGHAYIHLHLEIYTMVEHRSGPDPRMPLRVMRYTVEFWERLLRSEPERRMLPPIISLVVHHGPGGWSAPRSVHEMVEGLDQHPVLRAYVPNLVMLVDDLALVDRAALRARPLPPVPKVATWLLRDGRHVDALLTNMDEWKEDLGRVVVESPDEGFVFLSYISRTATERDYREVLRIIIDCIPAAEAPLATIEEQIKQEGRLQGRQEGRQEGRLQGRQEGLEAGRVEALRDVLRLLLEQRFGPVGADHETLISAAGLDELQRAVARVAVASDLASVFQPH